MKSFMVIHEFKIYFLTEVGNINGLMSGDFRTDVTILWKSLNNNKEFDHSRFDQLLDSYFYDKELETLEAIFS